MITECLFLEISLKIIYLYWKIFLIWTIRSLKITFCKRKICCVEPSFIFFCFFLKIFLKIKESSQICHFIYGCVFLSTNHDFYFKMFELCISFKILMKISKCVFLSKNWWKVASQVLSQKVLQKDAAYVKTGERFKTHKTLTRRKTLKTQAYVKRALDEQNFSHIWTAVSCFGLTAVNLTNSFKTHNGENGLILTRPGRSYIFLWIPSWMSKFSVIFERQCPVLAWL